MSYTPTTWATGDVITAEKLNNMESGIVSASNRNAVVFEFTATYDLQSHSYSVATDVTFEEVKSTFLAGKLCIAHIVAGQDDIYDIVLNNKGIYSVEGTVITMGLGNNYLSITYRLLTGDEWSGWRFSTDQFKVALSNA